MKRRFYSDPLAAAWMAKHFGMYFFLRDSGSLKKTRSQGKLIDYGRRLRAFVHLDSLQLLEPLEGDLVEYEMRDSSYVDRPPRRTNVLTKTESHRKYDPPFHPRKEWITRIILRNGILFMWPESEEP